MNDQALFDATAPVLWHYMNQINTLLSELPSEHSRDLQARLAPQAFSAAEHFDTAIGFAERAVLPLLGRQLADENQTPLNQTSLMKRARDTAVWLSVLSPAEFTDASNRVIEHTAGEVQLEQDATRFVTLFAMPNFFFHLSMAFAILRQQGVDIGKADFDGQHHYAKGFHFPTETDGKRPRSD